MLPEHARRLPVYAVIVAIHLPVIVFFGRRLAALATTHRVSHQAFLVASAAILGGFLATNVITFDYARHLGNLALCFSLLAMAQILATTGPVREARDIDAANPAVMAAAIIVAILPWTGTVLPLV